MPRLSKNHVIIIELSGRGTWKKVNLSRRAECRSVFLSNHRTLRQEDLCAYYYYKVQFLQSLLALNPKVQDHANLVSTVATKKARAHWKRNQDKECSVSRNNCHFSKRLDHCVKIFGWFLNRLPVYNNGSD